MIRCHMVLEAGVYIRCLAVCVSPLVITSQTNSLSTRLSLARSLSLACHLSALLLHATLTMSSPHTHTHTLHVPPAGLHTTPECAVQGERQRLIHDARAQTSRLRCKTAHAFRIEPKLELRRWRRRWSLIHLKSATGPIPVLFT